MRWIKEKPIIIIPLMLLLAFLLLPLLYEEGKPRVKHASVAPEKFPATGFPDYDLIPDKLKQRMEKLVKEDTIHRYEFYYFFEVDDVNRHYYIDDYPMNTILEAQEVKNHEAFKLVDERLIANKRGFSIEYHPNYQEMAQLKKITRESYTRLRVHYVFPDEEADFRKLRVGIFKDTVNLLVYDEPEELPDTKTYNFQNVDTPPSPVRGKQYFHNVIKKYLEDKLVYFNFYDMEGVVKAEFTIGGKAGSPQIIEGFSTREDDRDEAYKLDGLIVKALNAPKVRWDSGIKNGKNVNTRVGMDFYFAFNEEGKLTLNMSDVYPATKTF